MTFGRTSARTKFSTVLLAVVFLARVSVVADMGLMIPAYFGWWEPDAAKWEAVRQAAAKVKVAAIFNPGNGPGVSRSAEYAALVASCRAAGVLMIGYVYTSYGARPAADVKADVDRHYLWYDVDGIFFDEATNTEAGVAHYADLNAHVKAKGPRSLVIINPGSNVPESYITGGATDVICVFESNTGYPGWTPAPWMAGRPADHFFHLPYNVAGESVMRDYLRLAAERNAGWVYISDDVLPNPWDALPTYWTVEVDAVEALNVPPAIPRPRRLRAR